ncbi:hypothetical protein B0F90DRAFT_1814281 [Multifurca ochricompacta]|uniref:TEA domain-containing protein n=1 Tax=Multifurca ochricompacta TaxID=376703 RepID=A0AAD4M9Q1_9AGAM|nr:hypothetical protein B0F90DRAFT_1814281 [Multifurca ochricompacta]
MGMSPSPKSSPRGARSSPSPSGHRTLTPQRKHRKMLKDGTSEVWPESVEKIFVDGLWDRTSKKQVASHIQVLRNMWKGEKEYQLVAGGEELFQENGLLAHKSGPSRVSPSDVCVKEELKEVQSPFPPRTPSDSSEFPSESESASLDALHALDMPIDRTPGAFLAPLPLPRPSQHRGSVKDEGFDLSLPFSSSAPPPSSFVGPSASSPHRVQNSVTAVSLCADGMQPLVVDVSRYALPSSSSLPNYPSHVSIHIKLSLSSLHDVSSPPTLHGFSGTVTFAAPWTSVAQCVTRVFAGGVCESVEYAYFEPPAQLSPVSMTPITTPLPESGLSSCRWGTIGVETRLIQQVIVDHEELAWITYDLTRTANGPPTAEVLSVQRNPQDQHLAAPTAIPEAASFLNLNNWSSGSYSPYTSYVPRSQEPSAIFPPYSSHLGSSPTLPDSGDHQYTQYSSSVLFS